MLCAPNYFGDGCTTFCRARDDRFGHFNCSPAGQKLCLEGWSGPDCERAQCRPGCDQLHGFCHAPNTCQCRPGWTGPRCDQCLTYPGCQNGYCLAPWQCTCHQNWGGVYCDQDLNYCATHEPCRNNGTCQNVAPGRYRCHCPKGSAGANCELPDGPSLAGQMTQLSAGCALSPCLNGGTCYAFDSQLAPAGSGPGSDSSEAGLYRCQCPSGWTGDYCQWAEAVSAPTDLLVEGPLAANSSSSPSEPPGPPPGQPSESADVAELIISEHSAGQSAAAHLDMRHLISGVVGASALGVFLAALLLAWCCLAALERNKLPFIQMNVIRAGGKPGEQAVVPATLRRMQERIRDSFRRASRRAKIKPETKLSIENVLRPAQPPPSYEECGQPPPPPPAPQLDESLLLAGSWTRAAARGPRGLAAIIEAPGEGPQGDSLVKPESQVIEVPPLDVRLAEAQLACPRHGHLYRQQATCGRAEPEVATTIQIEYNPAPGANRLAAPAGLAPFRQEPACGPRTGSEWPI